MRKMTLALLLSALLAVAAFSAQADGYALSSSEYGSLYLSVYQDALNRLTGEALDTVYSDAYFEGYSLMQQRTIRIISKNASVWAEPRTNSKKLGSVSNNTDLIGRVDDYGQVWEENGFYPVEYNGKQGWVNSAYAVLAPVEIVLMESNVPAYSAPDRRSKRVGSLSKLTRYTIIGTFDEYFIINLRQASAFVPMDVPHYDSSFESRYLPVNPNAAVSKTIQKTDIRTGPGKQYPTVRSVKAGFTFVCLDIIDGWCLMYDEESDALVYLPAEAVQVTWG